MPTTPTETPRTDAIAARIRGGGDIRAILGHIADLTEHARTLERELSAKSETGDSSEDAQRLSRLRAVLDQKQYANDVMNVCEIMELIK